MAKEIKDQYVERKYLEDLKELIDYVGKEYGNKTAYRYREGQGITDVSFEKFSADVTALGEYILSLGYKDGDRIALLGEIDAWNFDKATSVGENVNHLRAMVEEWGHESGI